MKIAGINGIIVKLFQRLYPHTRSTPPLTVRLLAFLRFALVLLILRDTGKKLGGLQIDPPLGHRLPPSSVLKVCTSAMMSSLIPTGFD